MRRRIAAVGGSTARKIVLTDGKDAFAGDRAIRELVQSGAVTHKQLKQATSCFMMTPQDFLWLAEIDDAMLEKANRIFLITQGRHPVEDADFRLNGPYFSICKSLDHDPHYYDHQLQAPPRAAEPDVPTPAAEPANISNAAPQQAPSPPAVPETPPPAERPAGMGSETLSEPPQPVEAVGQTSAPTLISLRRQTLEVPPQPIATEDHAGGGKPLRIWGKRLPRRSIWTFSAVVVVGICSAPLLALLIAACDPSHGLTAGVLLGGAWLLILFGSLALTLPWRLD